MPTKTPEGKLLPKTRYERYLHLKTEIYALRLHELTKKVCAKDKPKVEREFLLARLEAESLDPERIDYDEDRYQKKYARQFEELKQAA